MLKLLRSVTFLLCALVSAFSAWAGESEELLARDIREAKIYFGTEKYLYHYFDIYNLNTPEVQKKLKTESGRKEIARERILYATHRFWDKSTKYNGLFAGNGFYLAIDPVISSEYGASMLELSLKPDSYYLDLNRGINLKADTVRALHKEKILWGEEAESFRFSEMTLNTILHPGNEKLRDLIHKVFKREKVTLIEYSWRSNLDLICGEGASQSAFLYVGVDPEMPEFEKIQMVDIKDQGYVGRLSSDERKSLARSKALAMFIEGAINSVQVSELPVNNRREPILHKLFGCPL